MNTETTLAGSGSISADIRETQNPTLTELQAWADLRALVYNGDIPKPVILKDGKMITIMPGEIHASVRTLAGRWNWSKDRVHRWIVRQIAMKKLQRRIELRESLLSFGELTREEYNAIHKVEDAEVTKKLSYNRDGYGTHLSYIFAVATDEIGDWNFSTYHPLRGIQDIPYDFMDKLADRVAERVAEKMTAVLRHHESVYHAPSAANQGNYEISTYQVIVPESDPLSRPLPHLSQPLSQSLSQNENFQNFQEIFHGPSWAHDLNINNININKNIRSGGGGGSLGDSGSQEFRENTGSRANKPEEQKIFEPKAEEQKNFSGHSETEPKHSETRKSESPLPVEEKKFPETPRVSEGDSSSASSFDLRSDYFLPDERQSRPNQTAVTPEMLAVIEQKWAALNKTNLKAVQPRNGKLLGNAAVKANFIRILNTYGFDSFVEVLDNLRTDYFWQTGGRELSFPCLLTQRGKDGVLVFEKTLNGMYSSKYKILTKEERAEAERAAVREKIRIATEEQEIRDNASRRENAERMFERLGDDKFIPEKKDENDLAFSFEFGLRTHKKLIDDPQCILRQDEKEFLDFAKNCLDKYSKIFADENYKPLHRENLFMRLLAYCWDNGLSGPKEMPQSVRDEINAFKAVRELKTPAPAPKEDLPSATLPADFNPKNLDIDKLCMSIFKPIPQ